jgi:hypothetical protein
MPGPRPTLGRPSHQTFPDDTARVTPPASPRPRHPARVTSPASPRPRHLARVTPPASPRPRHPRHPQTMPYRLDESTGLIDYDTMEKTAALFRWL